MKPPYRKIIHVDMDAFYASVAQLDDPTLLGKPIAVGGSGTRGVVSAASYEARKYGVRSAMSGVLAKKKCPSLIFVPTNFKRYKEISAQVRAIFYEFTDLVEPLSLDEAYLDVTVNKKNMPSATVLAQHIRHRILKEVGLHASAGISINKFIAKIASDINKPQGQKTVPPEEVLPFLENLDIAKFYGVGKVTRAKMYNLGIFTGADLKSKSEAFLIEHFKKSGSHYYQIVRGIHHSEVKPDRIQKSLAAEHTFSTNLTSEVYMLEQLQQIAKELARRAEKSAIKGKTVTLKIKYSDFTLQTRSKTLPTFFNDESTIMNEVKTLLYKNEIAESVRLLGISLSNLNTEKTTVEEPLEVQLTMEF